MAASSDDCTMAAEAAAEMVMQKLKILRSHSVWLGCLPVESQAKVARENLAMIQKFFSTDHESPRSTEWLGRFLLAMDDAEELIDNFHLREACRRNKALNMATRPLATLFSKYMLCRDLSNLVKDMKEFCQDLYLGSKKKIGGDRKMEPASSSSGASDRWRGKRLVRVTTFWDEQASTNFVWCTNEKKKIMKRITAVKDPWDMPTISIVGEQSTGKTFLARWVYKEAVYLGFDPRAWVHVSPSMDLRDLLFEILKQVSEQAGDICSMDLKEIRNKLSMQLTRGKFLIVLDGLQSSHGDPVDRLLMFIPSPKGGCIIITTRDQDIAGNINLDEDQIRLNPLTRKQIREMLAKKLHRVADANTLSSEEEKIIDSCSSLPLYISLLGGILSNAGEDERTVLSKCSSNMPLSSILALSYHRLPDHLKPCLIYMALFPVAFPIPTRRLLRLWLAEGLLDSHCYDKEGKLTGLPEDVGETFILQLADRNVIEVLSWRADGSPKTCQMLTSLYDMIRPIAMNTGFIHIHPKERKDSDPAGQQQQLLTQLQERARVRWLAEHMSFVEDGRGGSYPDLSFDHVRSFLSFYPRRGILTRDVHKFLRKLTSDTNYSLLRVLDLEGVYKPSLQGMLRKLLLLRYLGLRSTVLDSIPREVADLQYLETLDIKYTNITLLPSSLWKARNLRHLHLNWFYIDLETILKARSDSAMALTQLQTLSGLIIGEGKENLMRDHMDSFTTLTTLKLFLQRSGTVTSGTGGKVVADWINSRLTKLQSLTFGVIQEAEPHKGDEPKISQMGALPELSLAEQHHELLELYLLGRLEEPIWTQLLPGSLRVLTLSGSMVERDMMPELGALLTHLRTLRLLAKSFRGESMRFVKDGFPSLVVLKIWKLPELKKVIIQPGAMHQLKKLECRFLNKLKDIDGIDECKTLETIRVVVRKDITADYVKNLECGKNRYLYVEEASEDDP